MVADHCPRCIGGRMYLYEPGVAGLLDEYTCILCGHQEYVETACWRQRMTNTREMWEAPRGAAGVGAAHA